MKPDEVALSEMLAKLDVLPWGLPQSEKCGAKKRNRDLQNDSCNEFKVPYALMLKMLPKRLHPAVLEKTCLIRLFRDNAKRFNVKKLSDALKLYVLLLKLGYIKEYATTLTPQPKQIDLSDYLDFQTQLSSETDRLLCLMDVARSRQVITVSDIRELGLKTIDEVAAHWFTLKSKHPFNICKSKQHAIDDLMAQYPSVNGSNVVMNANEVENALKNTAATWIIAIRCQQLQLFELAKYWASLSTTEQFETQTGIVNATALKASTTSTNVLPFFLDNVLPIGATQTADAVVLANGFSLSFEWYLNDLTGIIDLENMFVDITGLAQRCRKKQTTSEVSFFDLCVTLGFEFALDKLIAIAQTEHRYPMGIVPLFDLESITPDTQSKALAIHSATGNFLQNITNFIDETTGNTLKVPKKRVCNFAPKDWCLLNLTLFSKFGDTAESVKKTFQETKLLLKQTDIDLIRCSKPNKTDMFANFIDTEEAWKQVNSQVRLFLQQK